jgi:hypothetical protein
MAIENKVLKSEKELLEKDFNNLSNKIKITEKELSVSKSNLNALYGAIQQIDKLIKMDNTVEDNKKNEKI